jgi:hypothetical protein
MKTVGGLRKTRYRGRERVQLRAYLVAAAYNQPCAHRAARPSHHMTTGWPTACGDRQRP